MTIILSLFLSFNSWGAKKPVWVYTSIYKENMAMVEEAFEKANPDLDMNLFQAGSEKIQAKVEAELLAGKPQADIILTSNPFWGEDLKKRKLLWEKSPEPELNYYSAMIIIYNKNLKAGPPKSFKDLTKPEYKNLIQMGSPMESGTHFTTVAVLSDKYGWDFFKQLRQNELSAVGGNSTVLQKVESGEKMLGVVLLENAIMAKKKGSPIEIIYPTDGTLLLPSKQVILKDAENKEAADRFGKFILSKVGQQLLVKANMYSARSDVTSPEGAKPFKELLKGSPPWSKEFLEKTSSESKSIKKKFNEIVLQ